MLHLLDRELSERVEAVLAPVFRLKGNARNVFQIVLALLNLQTVAVAM